VCKIRIEADRSAADQIGDTRGVCGIGGIVGAPAPEEVVLRRMARAMAHRGPDDEGIWAHGSAGLVFRRLAIIDLDPRSNQPLHLDGLHLCFNGEIYNYRELRNELRGLGHAFVTEGDGEVLLHAWREWGEAALDRVNGMFALAIWDEGRRSLTLASDPFGEKPLYYGEVGGNLVFASDIRALIGAVDGLGAPDERALRIFVARDLMPAPEGSFFAGVRRLPAAHLLRWRDGCGQLARYWTPRRVEVPAQYGAAVAQLRALLVDSIRLRLRSDVPVGTSLSGGVDSSAIVALSAELGLDHRRHAFTARFPGYERDEWGYAEQVARAAEVVQHHAVEPDPEDLAGDLDALIRDQEEPFGSTSMYAQWLVMRTAREAGVVVLLDGQGADELLGGYPWMVGVAARSRGAQAAMRALLAGGEQRRSTTRSLIGSVLPPRLGRTHSLRLASPYVNRDAAQATLSFQPPPTGFEDGSLARRELILETFVTSLPTLLRYADRDSMAHAREVRLPFLDRRVAEFALSLPAAFICRGGVTKRILRDAARGLVPEPVLARRDKVAFETPQARWLATPAWRERIGSVLLDPATTARAIYDAPAIEADLRTGIWRDHAAIWRAFCAETWRRSFAPATDRSARVAA
jgi:asparagine synthase (glutamine-hydrolysing)